MINLIINRTSGDPSYLWRSFVPQDDGCLAGDLMSLPFLNIFKMLRTTNDMNVKIPLGKLGERKTGYMRGRVKSGAAAFHSPPTQCTILVAELAEATLG